MPGVDDSGNPTGLYRGSLGVPLCISRVAFPLPRPEVGAEERDIAPLEVAMDPNEPQDKPVGLQEFCKKLNGFRINLSSVI